MYDNTQPFVIEFQPNSTDQLLIKRRSEVFSNDTISLFLITLLSKTKNLTTCPATATRNTPPLKTIRANITIYARLIRTACSNVWTSPAVTWVDLGLISWQWESHSMMMAMTRTTIKAMTYMPLRALGQSEKRISAFFY